MTKQAVSTGDDQVFSDKLEDRPGNRPDETGDETAVKALREARRALTSGVRRCACCGNPLPPPTREAKKPRKYCPDGQGGFEDSHGITCAELGPAKEKVDRVFDHAAVPPAGLERLGEQIAAAQDLLGPESPVTRLLTGLAGTMTGVGDQLENTVAEALARAERAEADAREARGEKNAMEIERDTATHQAQQAVLDRQAAERDRDTKVRAAENAVKTAQEDQRTAERAQTKAEAERDLYQEQATRAGEAAERDRVRAEETARENTELTTKVTELTERLRQAGADLTAQREQTQATLDRIAAETEAKIETIRDRAREEVDAERVRADGLAAEFRRDLQAIRGRHTTQLRRVDRQSSTALATVRQLHRDLAAARRRPADVTDRECATCTTLDDFLAAADETLGELDGSLATLDVDEPADDPRT
ncbi:hypothetical protein EV193_102557 [Herbihabitans rhizosphaerae]|uniref:Uncharacterized protein n=1 Tax=Herbihabitans rhizosphaerae TaxID=1872711 RepID=A0A4Q7L2W7_9PSEU|nr:hypothetical protein [Herbihabitans rhizosphaerae]RZS43577.1 hypothetical protein EV193_102557 [Herbihabitans rhizosphaerae]